MGRWAQRTRCGGGASLNFMTGSTFNGVDVITVTFLTPITLADFNAGSFQTEPAHDLGSSISQPSANQIDVDFGLDITASTGITYTGQNANVLSPQTVNTV